MNSKIFLLTFSIFLNAALAQLPTGLPPNFVSNLVPSLPANVGVPSVSVNNGIPSISSSGGQPSLPANAGIPSIPSLPSPGGIPTFPPNGGLIPSFPFPGILNPNWSRPSLSSTSPIWQKYFKQLQAARKELLQSLNNNNQNSNKTGVEIRAQNNVKIPTPPPLFPGQNFQFLPQIQNAISQFINQWRPPTNGRPQRLFPGNNP